MTSTARELTVNCLHCGAALLKGGTTNVICPSCRARILIPPEKGKVVNWKTENGMLRIMGNNKPVRCGRYPFAVECAEHPLLQRYRGEFPFESVFAGADDEFAALVKLRTQVRNKWFAARPSSAFLKRYGFWRANRRNNYWFCTHVARMFVLTATALGYPARVVNVARGVDKIEDNLHGHMVIDVWSNQYQKWVYMDVLFDFHYEDADGTPLSLLEARDLYWRKNCRGLVVSTLRTIKDYAPGRYPLYGRQLSDTAAAFKERSLNTFWALFFHGQNYFSVPLEERRVAILCYEDDLNQNCKIIGNGKEHYVAENMLRRTSSRDDIYPTMNNAEIGLYELSKIEDRARLIYINTHTPNLKHVSYRINHGRWKNVPTDGIALPSVAQPLLIEARTQNRFGHYGALSSATITP